MSKANRLGDKFFRSMLTIFRRNAVLPLAPDAYMEIIKLLNEEAQVRGFKEWRDADDNFRWSEETSNDATGFEQLAKERAIAIKGLRKIERQAHGLHTDEDAKAGERIIAEEFCNMAHNALDEIGDDRESEL